MKFNNIPDFLDALQDRMDELRAEGITSSENIEACGDIDACGDIEGCGDIECADDIVNVDDIVAEAEEMFTSPSDITKYIFEQLSNEDFTDDEIYDILQQYGY